MEIPPNPENPFPSVAEWISCVVVGLISAVYMWAVVNGL